MASNTTFQKRQKERARLDKQREKAEKRLGELGRLAVPNLKTVLNNADPEVAYRAERILLAQNEKIDGT